MDNCTQLRTQSALTIKQTQQNKQLIKSNIKFLYNTRIPAVAQVIQCARARNKPRTRTYNTNIITDVNSITLYTQICDNLDFWLLLLHVSSNLNLWKHKFIYIYTEYFLQ